MPLAAGTRLGPYEIGAPIGKGGMGEVYRARDTKLERNVAIKVLPEEFARDAERVARFEREAKVLASLNHPNIASIHGLEDADGVSALVLELVEGPTLAERIERGPIPVDEAVSLATQIAAALEAGHEAGVVHRDLKPANVKLKEDGTVKVLDYGLAKALEGDTTDGTGTDGALSQSPTLTRQGTQLGVILGTAAYMSPEQAKGKRVDKRADIWAFGVVLFEMLSGAAPFSGDTVSEVLASVIKDEPDWTRLPKGVPPSIRNLLRRSLQKDPKRRLRDIGEAWLILDEPGYGEAKAGGGNAEPRPLLPWLLFVAMTGIAIVLASRSSRVPDRESQTSLSAEIRLEVPQGARDGRWFDLSPDGTRLVYVGAIGRPKLYLRELDRMESVPLAGTEDAERPFFSHDGQWVGFFAIGELKKVSVTGGGTVTLAAAPNSRGGTWGPDGSIVFAANATGPLSRVSESGGEPRPVMELGADELTQRWPQFLPGGKAILFTSHTRQLGFSDANIEVLDLDTGERELVHEGGTDARYSPSGHLIFGAQGGTVFAVPFDPEKLSVMGSVFPLFEEVSFSVSQGDVRLALSQTGLMVYKSGESSSERSPVAIDLDGTVTPLTARLANYGQGVSVSPDGRRLALTLDSDIWLLDVDRDDLQRITFTGARTMRPVRAVFSPDGSRLAFSPSGGGVSWTRADGSGEADVLVKSDLILEPGSFSPDGKILALTHFGPSNGGGDVVLLAVDAIENPKRELEPFAASPAFEEYAPRFSPDGRFIAYTSNESGREEIYVKSHPEAGRKTKISTDRGYRSQWAASSGEIYYDTGEKFMAVTLTVRGTELVAGRPRELFPFRTIGTFDVFPDGRRIAALRQTEAVDDGGPSDDVHLTLVVNAFEAIRRARPRQ